MSSAAAAAAEAAAASSAEAKVRWDTDEFLLAAFEHLSLPVAIKSGAHLVCRRWYELIRRQANWRRQCLRLEIPLLDVPNPDEFDWYPHFASAYTSLKTKNALYQAIASRKNVFISGPGGVGKSRMIDDLRHGFASKDVTVALTAPTGSAAHLIRGCTINRWSSCGIFDGTPEELAGRMRGPAKRKWRDTHVLIIDEVSMLSRAVLEKLDRVARIVRGRPDNFFGGLQVIFSGDFCQLPPVSRDALSPEGQFVINSPVWEANVDHVFEFHHIFRSQDSRFSELLLRARLGTITDEDYALLQSRVNAPIEHIEGTGIIPTQLYAHNDDADRANAGFLAALETPAKEFQMYVGTTLRTSEDDQFRRPDGRRFAAVRAETAVKKNCPVPETLVLKKGAQVILVVNVDPDNGLVNGARGVVEDVDHPKGPVVRFASGLVVIERHTWERPELSDNNEPVTVTVRQYPLKLGWAMTVHRSQGVTLNAAVIDLGVNNFAAGMAYVQLSRVKSLASLSISNLDRASIFTNPTAKNFYDFLVRTKSHKGFVDQLSSTMFPLIGEMLELADEIPRITAEREARLAEREAARATLSLDDAMRMNAEDFKRREQAAGASASAAADAAEANARRRNGGRPRKYFRQ